MTGERTAVFQNNSGRSTIAVLWHLRPISDVIVYRLRKRGRCCYAEIDTLRLGLSFEMERQDDRQAQDERSLSTSRAELRDVMVQTTKVQSTDRVAVPSIYQNSTVITAQPQIGETRHQRRPIPISTLDWVSTPRSQLSATSGEHFLGGVEQLEIQQIVDLNTLMGRFEKGVQYRIKVPRAETLFLAMESKSDVEPTAFGRCKLTRGEFTLNFLDQSGENSFVMTISSNWYIPGALHKISVESTNLIGTVEENFSILGPSFTVYDLSRKKLCNIYGPNVPGFCMYREAQFQVISVDGTHQLASLMHQWDNILLDYTLLLTFPVDTDMKLKSLLLGAAFLTEYLYFERIRKASRRK
ncbi:hypothetical protein KM043_009376 [Ampulex compressa]|nr:hypothetical protein KM043_009376 [Ampulex compressa]